MSPRDAGLQAVRRVREVRERDAVVILHEARTASDAAVRLVDDARAALADVPALVPAEATAASALLLTRSAWVAGGQRVLADRTRDAAAAELELGAARDQWTIARARLRAIELLQERRAAEWRAAVVRHEQRESDDLAGSRRRVVSS